MLRTHEDFELRAFDPVIRSLHWLTLFLVATVFVLVFAIDFAPTKEGAVTLTQLHRSFGMTVWVVTLGRVVWRQFSRFPNWPSDMPQAMRFAVHWSEYALYALLLVQPILGILHTNAHSERPKAVVPVRFDPHLEAPLAAADGRRIIYSAARKMTLVR